MRSDDLSIHHARLGEISISQDEIFHLPGMPGFPDAKRFVVREHDGGSPFAWLVCVDRVDLAFVIADPWNFFPDYRPEFRKSDLRAIEHQEQDGVFAVVIARVTADATSLNLAAPLLLNLRTRKGIQVVLDQGDYSTHRPISGFEPASASEAQTGSERVEAP